MILREIYSCEKKDNEYYLRGDSADMIVMFLTCDIVRVRVSFDRNFKEKSYSLIKTAWKDEMDNLFEGERTRINALNIDVEDKSNCYVFKTNSLKIEIYKKPAKVTIWDNEGNEIYTDLSERSYERDFLGRTFHYVQTDPKHDHYYGFGEKTGKLDKIGDRMRMSPKDAIGHDPESGDPLYKHIPFYIKLNDESQNASGFFYDNTYESTFDMGKERSGYWAPYSYYEADGGDINLFFINGPSVSDVINRYTFLTGKQALPPKQSLGYTASTMYYAELEKDADREIYDVIDTYDKEKINIDNFWLASGYSSGVTDNLRYTFNWNNRRFPNPDQFFKKMNDKGINVIPNLKPGVLENHPYMEKYREADAFIKNSDGKEDYIGRWWGGAGRFVDFTNPQARNVWKELLKKTILQKGTSTVWNDNCEYDGVEDRNAICDDEGHKTPIAELKSVQPNMMAYVAKQAIGEINKNQRPYIINRAGYAGIQRYAQTWAGDNLTDWRTLKYEINTILGMGLSGVANQGCDIGGFAGGVPEGELLLRWIQNGIFQPRFCINSANDDNTVTQPFMYEEYNDYVRDAYHLRYRLLPYLYSMFAQAHKTGLPIWRPTFMEFQNDVNCYDDRSSSFMFGPSLLVANVVEKGATTRKVYLPKGAKWYDLNNFLKEYDGGQVIEIPVGLDSIPMFLRDNGIFITSPDIERITKDTLKHLDILIGDAENSHFTYYDDDGVTNDFEKGVYRKTDIVVSGTSQKKIHFESSGSYKDSLEAMTIRLIDKRKGALWVSIDGKQVKRYLVKQQWEDADEGWYYNLSDQTIMVKGRIPQKDSFDVIVSTEKFDLIGMQD